MGYPRAVIDVRQLGVGSDESVDRSCVGQGLRPAATSHRPLCSAICNYSIRRYPRARGCA